MAGKIFKAGIRFNDPEFKYMSFIFYEDSSTCIVDAVVALPQTGNVPMALRGIIESWTPLGNESNSGIQAPTVSTTRTTAKKAVKENK